MVADTSTVKPANQIVLDSRCGMSSITKKVQTATNMYAGRLVMHGTADNQIVVNDGTGPLYGWLGYEQTAKKYRPADVDTIYVISSHAAVIWGPGMRLVGSIPIVGAAIVVGTLLTQAPAGQLTPGTAGTHDIVATAEEANAGSATGDLIVRSRI